MLGAGMRSSFPAYKHGEAFHQNRPIDPLWDQTVTQRALAAEAASKVLQARIQAMFDRFEVSHGLDHGEAQVLMLDTGMRRARKIEAEWSAPALNEYARYERDTLAKIQGESLLPDSGEQQ
jgi:hypothetical protein